MYFDSGAPPVKLSSSSMVPSKSENAFLPLASNNILGVNIDFVSEPL